MDIWINNAVVNQPDKSVAELKASEIEFLLEVDLKGCIYGSKIAFFSNGKAGLWSNF